MRRMIFCVIMVLLTCGVSALAAVPDLSFVIHGRSPIEPQDATSPFFGLVETALFADDEIILTVSAVKPSADWARRVRPDVRTETGEAVSTSFGIRANEGRSATPLRPDVERVDFVLGGLPPGRFIVTLTWAEGDEVLPTAVEARRVVIYKGDENDAVRRMALRVRAKQALASGTSDSYRVARDLLLQAAEGSTDPSIYEELADASAPWASPDETADYYKRSLDVARRNLEQKFGPRDRWPENAVHLYTAREKKMEAFRSVLPYYRMNFNEVRVVVVRMPQGSQFAVERRSDGKRLRAVSSVP